MNYLLNITDTLLQDTNKVVSYSLIIICFIVLIVASILILRLDKLQLVLKFIYLFFKQGSKPRDFEEF